MGRKWDKMEPGEIRDCGHNEHVLLQGLYVLDARLQEINLLKYRAGAIENGWRDLRMVQTVTRRLLKQLLNTLPDKRLRQFDALWQHGSLNIMMDTVLAKKQGMLPVDIDDMNTVINYAIQHECSLCLKDGREIKSCQLRRAVMNMMPPKDTCAVGCEYRHIMEALAKREAKV